MKSGPVHNLKSLQRQMMAALMTPLTRTDGISRRNTEVQKAARLIKPNPRLKAFERLEIYNRSYWFRLLESLSDDFPGLVAVLGWTAFERMAKAYLLECPSESFTLRDLGSRLEAWLRAHPRHAGPNRVLALDMAQLEWAHIVAFDAPGERTLQPEDLADLGQGMKIGLQPCMSLLELHYPVDDLRVRVNASPEGAETASNAALRKKHTMQCGQLVRRMKLSRPQPIFLAVHRVDLSVYYRRLDAEEFRLLQALREGEPIGAAIGTAFEGSKVGSGEIPGLLQSWFSTWAQLGWLCAHF